MFIHNLSRSRHVTCYDLVMIDLFIDAKFEVKLSLVYHVISVTYVQFLTITSIFCMENCKRYLTVIRIVM